MIYMNRRNKKGWFGERERHRASAYGIETTNKSKGIGGQPDARYEGWREIENKDYMANPSNTIIRGSPKDLKKELGYIDKMNKDVKVEIEIGKSKYGQVKLGDAYFSKDLLIDILEDMKDERYTYKNKTGIMKRYRDKSIKFDMKYKEGDDNYPVLIKGNENWYILAPKVYEDDVPTKEVKIKED